VAGGDTFEGKKPDPAAIHFLFERYRVAPSDVLVIGDHSPDINMAKRAGVRSVFCSYGFFGNDEVGADYKIDAFPELLTVLQNIEAESNHPGRPTRTKT
jgi:phosphoglycolate phosphatase